MNIQGEYADKYAGLKIKTYRNVHIAKACFRERFIMPLRAWKRAGLPKPDEYAIAEIRGGDL